MGRLMGTVTGFVGADGLMGADGDSHRVLLSTFAEPPSAAASRELPTQRPNRLPTRHFGPKRPPPPRTANHPNSVTDKL